MIADLSLRPAVRADARALATIHVAGRRAAYSAFLPARVLDAVTIDSREGEWLALFANPPAGAHATVAERDGAVVGFTLVADGLDDDIPFGGELRLLYVEPDLRGTGIGLVLFDHATALLRNRGQEPYLYTLAENAPARRFYENRGWRCDGVTRPFPAQDPVAKECRYRSPRW